MKHFFSLLLFSIVALFANGNNITVANATLSGQNTVSHYTLINFDISWENSWRTSTNENNYDGAWIFVKYRKNSTSDWRHCTISSTGNTSASGSTFYIPSDNKGAFIYRSSDGIGNVNWVNNQLQWNYGVDGLLDNETVEIKVFALEMVYIPQGSFQLGSGGSETKYFMDGTTSNPYTVGNNNEITLGTGPGQLNPNGAGAAAGTLSVDFPKGYKAFWIMKYEISQQQFADFLNNIDETRATVNKPVSAITGIHPNLIAAAPESAIGYLNTSHIAAISDWSGLRPMTELEYEKACRGYNTPAVPNEYVWGNTQIFPLTSVNDQGTANEAVNAPANANATINSQFPFPTRTGLFARSSGSTRELSGGTYYGVMNMGDNVRELCIVIRSSQGRDFTDGIHGDGYLASSGSSNITTWASFQAYGYRGSSYNSPYGYACTSDRSSVSIYTEVYGYDAHLPDTGGRLVRTEQ
ncbi:MAG: hypothetical protein KF829_04580 [Ferruginibacter sp.]|nr:hypothetical protein [Ferruginibacter sp.]